MDYFDRMHPNRAMPDVAPAHAAVPSDGSFPSYPPSNAAISYPPIVNPEATRADAGMPDLEKGLASSVNVSMAEARPSAIPRVLSAIPLRISQAMVHPLQENDHRVSTSPRASGSVIEDSRKRSTTVRIEHYS